jgi:integrase
MLSRKRNGSSVNDVITYTLPKLHTTKNWYIDFFCFDPIAGKMKRKKYMLDAIDRKVDKKKRAAELIANTTNRLREGWNPWADVNSDRQYCKFADAVDLYIRYVDKLASVSTYKKKTFHDYHSHINMIVEYNATRLHPIIYMYQLDQLFVTDFLDYILLDRDSSVRTRNNYRNFFSTFCTWLVQKKYIMSNPCSDIKRLPDKAKFRSPFSPQQLSQLQSYLERENKYFLLACRMEYYTFIRPDELSNIRIGNIHLREQKVFISGTISKNRNDGMVGLNDELCRMMIDLGILSQPSTFYLFGKDFKPSNSKADSRIFRDYFKAMRKKLHWPDNLQFYSLKDSGIRDLANAEGIVIARDQARHSDISTTNKYLKGDMLTVHEETKHFEGNL